MSVFVDQEVSGAGVLSLGGGQSIQYLLVHVIDAGAGASPVEVESPDHILRLGWLSLGSATDVIGATERVYWNENIWINFLDFQWHPVPTRDPSTQDLTVWASHIRWQLGPGALIHLYVVGL